MPFAQHAALAVCLASIAGPAWCQQTSPIGPGSITVRAEIVTSGLGGLVGGDFQISPTEVVPDGSGRLFVATLGGIVRTIDDGSLLSAPFLTQAQSNTTPAANGESGMTGLAFHPDYLSEGEVGYGKFYTITTEPASANGGAVDFSVAQDHQDVIKEWNAIDPLADVFSGTVREVMRVGQPGFPHNVVDLAFGPDDYLYISSGDGGFTNPGSSQDLGSIHGKVLRIDPLNPRATSADRGAISANGRYRIPDDNPFVGEPGALGEVWARGLRSPFRMNFDRETGDLWVGDVGAGQREEVSFVEAGGNYGWPFFEGSRVINGSVDPDDFVPPVFEYLHNPLDGVSVIGGFVYRGSAIPELVGKYVFADLGEGLPSARLFYGDPATGERFELLLDPEGHTFLAQLGPEAGSELPLPERIISLGEDENGELYLAAVGIDPRQGGGVDGMVVAITAPTLPGDFNGDGRVDAADYTAWRDNDSGEFSPSDFQLWADNYGRGVPSPLAVPEPSAALASLLLLAGWYSASKTSACCSRPS